nr:MAG: internal scaffolding protein [Microvirus sp.]
MTERIRVRKLCSGGRTKQSFKQECDVNQIMKRFKRANAGASFLDRYQGYLSGQFGDFSNVVDYRTALDQVRQANDVFDRLPAIVRKRFGNDAAAFLDFVHDPSNQGEMVKMGLANAKPEVKKEAEKAPEKP